MKWLKMVAIAASGVFIASMAYSADEADFTGFLSSYEKLEVTPGEFASYTFIAPEAFQRANTYVGLMIDQPEIFIGKDSKYKGIKPADVTLIAETLRDAMASELSGLYEIVDEPGENVLLLRIALGNVDLKKTKRRLLAYTPAGAVVHAGVNLQKSVMGKTDLRGAVIEVEFLDSQTGEAMGQIIDVRARSQEPGGEEDPRPELDWDLLIKVFHTYGQRVACRVRNARLPEEEKVACPGKTIEDLMAEEEG